MVILVLNCGSSSIKYQVIDMGPQTNKLLAKGQVERIGLSDGLITHKPTDKPVYTFSKSIPDHTVGINSILSTLTDPATGVISTLNEIAAVGHRVAHGGEYFSDSAVVTPQVKQHIESCFELAPLHNPPALRGILSIEGLLPTIPQVAVFDTSFHQTIPNYNYIYALPYKYYEQMRVRKYGFHGTSHKYVAIKGCQMAGIDYDNSKVITCHIGNGASVTAILNGKSYDTSMGFTPVDGLMMGTRSGSIDPGALLYIADKEGYHINKLNDLINKESGVVGITDISSDMRDIMAAEKDGNERAILALKMYYSRILKKIGAYAAAMEGVDMIIFTGGVGENNVAMRHAVCKGLGFMGAEFSPEANEAARGEDAIISTDSSRVKLVVATTNEELVIASDTYRLLKGN